jgi:hypothetical protein
MTDKLVLFLYYLIKPFPLDKVIICDSICKPNNKDQLKT